jgi:ABC-2 type transport system permease protein
MTIAVRLLIDRRRSLLWWTIGIGTLVLVSVAFYPSVKDQESIDKIVKDLPEAMKSLLGFDPAVSFTKPAGYLQGRLFALLGPALLLVVGVGLAARATGGSEEDGTLELLLATPATRRQVATQRLGALIALIAALGAALALMTLAFSPPFGALDGVPVGHLFGACAALVTLTIFHAAIAFGVGAATGRRAHAVAAATTVAAAGYLFTGIAAVSTAVHRVRWLSPWDWYLGRNILAHGLPAKAIVTPIALAMVAAVAGIRQFERRDLRS